MADPEALDVEAETVDAAGFAQGNPSTFLNRQLVSISLVE
jgi:hypothetical protein